jgi:hypothetical protein
MPMRGELPPVSARSRVPPSAAEIVWSHVLAAIANTDLGFVVAFSLCGYLAALNLILRFPDFGQMVASLAIFP